MITYFRNKMNAILQKFRDNQSENQPELEETRTLIVDELKENIINLREKYKNSSDFLTKEIKINNIALSIVRIEGMIDLSTMSEFLLTPLLTENFAEDCDKNTIFDFIQERSILAADIQDVFTYEDVFRSIMSGAVVILIDGISKGIALGIQGFDFRSISEPASEVNEKGSREGFTEPLRINMTMVRRRVKSPLLKFEVMSIGKTSKTDVCLMYMTDKVSNKLLREIRYKLSQIKLDIVLTSGYIQPFLEGKPWSLFSDVGMTERPDVIAAKINEGRIAIVVDGTPYALIVPYLFTENFQSLDDYAHRAYYASFVRIIKYFSFIATILLPALYVGVGTFHPELLPHTLLFNVAAAEEITPFPLMFEALIIHLLYEIMREAGLRLPRAIGHAVSIVGALVIGDAAVSAGLIGAPMVLVVAMTAISSFVVPTLYEPVSLFRFVFIIIGGTYGLYGITLGCMVILLNICALNNFGYIYMSPISPFSFTSMRDTFIRVSFPKMQHKNVKIQDLNGMKVDSNE